MNDKNLEQRINVKFCVKIGKSVSETVPLLTWAYGEYAVMKLSVLNGINSSRKDKKMCKVTQEMGSQKCERRMQMWTQYKP
jgi:hypothetical protein